ncbi:MAG: S46 family peptidase [Bacteroidales bacterium]|nr:S46 family peptidase [Bacteroidales bacterium]
MKKVFVIISFIATCIAPLQAEEGMWLLPLLEKLNIGDMQKLGCTLSAEQIYSINQSSLKDAVVIFGGGCTGELISDEGLLITNHHCGYDAIQQHSSLEHNYLADGFWAKTRADEISSPNLKVTFLVRIEDVTVRIDSVLDPSMTETAREDAIDKKSNEIEEQAAEGTHYNASVRSFFGGNQYYLVVYEEFTDVRMVGAPPSSIGKFGADTDNWMWPRHTCDFSMFRVYADSSGHPARYSADNIPLKPKKYLPISLKGVEKNDFTMTLGYPGSTERYATSYEVLEMIENELPNRVKIRGEKQEIMMRHILANPAVKIKYATKYTRSSNYWKNSIGMMQGVKRLHVYDRKVAQEQIFTQWLAAHPEQNAKYGEALSLIKTGVERNNLNSKVTQYVSECFLQGTELVRFSLQFRILQTELEKKEPDYGKLAFITDMVRKSAEAFYKDYDRSLDMEVTEALLKRYYTDVPAACHPDFYRVITKKYKGDFHKYTQDWFKSVFADADRLNAFLAKPSAKTLPKDPVYQVALSLISASRQWYDDMTAGEELTAKGVRLYIAGLQEMEPKKQWYPDANFTMRLSYGSIKDYCPRDAVYYNYYTTLQGVMEKEDANNWEFVVPDRLKELYSNKDFGPYANAQGELPLCFISTNDITGGNSGSPVINGKGELLGLAFDGNWEAMSGDIVFEPDLQRTISVDIRYVLFIIDKYAGATHLIDEMTLVK